MTQLLRNKNLATKFQILVEIAANQPSIQQKDIARRIGVTSQAVSEYVIGLEKDGWITSDGRSRYRVTTEGVNWVLKAFRELQGYSNFVEKAVTNVMVSTAIADCDLSKGQKAGLVMREGLLFATDSPSKEAKGIATSDAKKGEDVGISDIEGIVELNVAKVTVLEVPDIQRGGSRSIDLTKLKKEIGGAKYIGVIGIEALVALRRVGVEPDYLYGVTEAAVEAARSGLPFLVVCAGREAPSLLQRLKEESLEYKLVNLGGNNANL